MWHDEEGGEPTHDLASFGGHFGEPGWVEWKIDYMGDLNVHGCEILDNMADYGHFNPIHGATDWQYFANEFTGHTVHQYYSAGHRTLTANPDDMLVLDTWYEGPGFLQSEMAGAFDSFIMIANTPIENGTTRSWHRMWKSGRTSAPASIRWQSRRTARSARSASGTRSSTSRAPKPRKSMSA
jgi:3-ketosteroid 9alpha-monooxygenase subunit A